ncbi:hypothetical protein D9O50_02680 [Oxalobacteraceae bacterium CAVE-383]|nr:hypothetical protein D9O50_02680 [Oxalobacteraceae bacterium CAVE-383]
MTNSISSLSAGNAGITNPSHAGMMKRKAEEAAAASAAATTSATSSADGGSITSASLLSTTSQTDNSQATTDAIQSLLDQLESQLNAALSQPASGTPVSGSTLLGASSSNSYDPADANQDGNVSAAELTAYQQTSASQNNPNATAKGPHAEDAHRRHLAEISQTGAGDSSASSSINTSA